jgi:hypothetical protein
MKNTKRHARRLSAHAAKLLKRRNRRLYNHFREEGEGQRLTRRLAKPGFAQSSIPGAITATRVAEISISITLLGKMTLTLHVPGGIIRAIPLNLNPRNLQLLAYLAWKRSTGVRRDLLLEEIWGHDRTGEDATYEKLSEAFNNAKKSLRSTVSKVIELVNNEQGEMLLDPKLNILVHRNQMWWLSPCCKVIDLEVIEEKYRIIREAKKRGELINLVPEHIKDACYELITTYSGDFCETLLKCYPLDLKTWASAWVREPITYYRDCYLWAVWYAAEYERQAGQRFADERPISDIESRRKQRECWARASELYRMYAMHACNNRLDTKVHFQLADRGNGERIAWSERALRECIMLCGKLGDPYLLNEIYGAYYDQMRDISDENWEPSEETLNVVQAARDLAAAYQPEG